MLQLSERKGQGKGKKKVKSRKKNWRPHRTSQYPKTSGPFVDERTGHGALGRTMQIDWKQGDILSSIFINNQIRQTRTAPSPRIFEPFNGTQQKDWGLPWKIIPPLIHKAIVKGPHLAQNIVGVCSPSSVWSLPLFSTYLLFPSPCAIPGNYASLQLWKFPSLYSKIQGFC